MNERKHTEGPWMATRMEVGSGYLIGQGYGRPARLTNIAHVGPNEANALLIAACPDLLAACEASLVELDAHDGGECAGCALEHSCTGCVKRKLRAAIAKAKGVPDATL